MQNLLPKISTVTPAVTDTPEWVLERIRRAKEFNLNRLDLSPSASRKEEKLDRFPEEVIELTGLNELSLAKNRLRSLPKSIAQLRRLTHLDLSGNAFETVPDPA